MNNGVDPLGVEQEVQSALRRPVLTAILLLVFVVFGIWYFTGGSATGSPHQAEQFIITDAINHPDAGATAIPIAETVHCTQDSQSLSARLRGLISPGGHGAANQSPPTYYSCSGTTTTGIARRWCVAYPPRGNAYGHDPSFASNPDGSCPS